VLFISAFCGIGNAFAQQVPGAKKDSVKVQIPAKINESKNYRLREGAFFNDPINLVRTFEYDAITNRYIMYERVGNLLYRPPQYLTFDEFLRYKEKENRRNYFKTLSDNYAYASQQPGFIPPIKLRSQTFDRGNHVGPDQ
jgi:hypothetical protein